MIYGNGTLIAYLKVDWLQIPLRSVITGKEVEC